MKTKPRIFVSVPDDRHLDERRQALKRAILSFVAEQDFSITGFEQEQFGAGLPPTYEEWTAERAYRLIRRCDGVLVLALARRHVRVLEPGKADNSAGEGRVVTQPTTYNHLEGALGLAQRLPVFILFEEEMDRDGIFASGISPADIPTGSDETWVSSDSFLNRFATWAEKVRYRRDVFLGYCSKANSPAEEIREYLISQGYSVLDWSRDFAKGGAIILEEIEKAASRCRCAVFLFTKDDEVGVKARGKASINAVPRDNVLVEAGYFTQARGMRRVAIIREQGAKMPADFGGIIYLTMEDREDLSSVKESLVNFLNDAL